MIENKQCINKMAVTIIRSVILLSIVLLVDDYIIYFSGLNIPKYIPSTPINLNGLFLTVIFITVLIYTIKKIIRCNNDYNIIQLTVFGFVTCLFAELIFQTTRNILFESENLLTPIYSILKPSIIIATVFGFPFSLFIAFQIKTKRTKDLVLIIFAIMIIIGIIVNRFPNLIEQNQ